MFVPLGGGLGPEVLVPHPPPSITPTIPESLSTGTGNAKLPKLEPAKNRADSSDSSSASSGTEGPTVRRSGETTPLDLSKSPDSLNNSHNKSSESIVGSDTEGESILPNQRHLPPPLRRASNLMKETGNAGISPSGTGNRSPVSEDQLKSREIEVQLQFLKAKQLEFLKDQHQ